MSSGIYFLNKAVDTISNSYAVVKGRWTLQLHQTCKNINQSVATHTLGNMVWPGSHMIAGIQSLSWLHCIGCYCSDWEFTASFAPFQFPWILTFDCDTRSIHNAFYSTVHYDYYCKTSRASELKLGHIGKYTRSSYMCR